MSVRRPAPDELQAAAGVYHFSLTADEVQALEAFIDATMRSYDRLDELVEPKLPVRYARQPGYRPEAKENPLGAWAWKCSIKGPGGGLLAGKRIAVKDNIAVAGVPMINGSALMEGFIADIDATVVTRILDAGGEITGKATCENLCFSGGSHTSYPIPVGNPYNPEYMAGGSSSGSAALVGAGECDMALGGDQGGSIRIPCAWSGIVGLKPTWGLVPYTGISPIELTLDHVGPMARSVQDLALLLDVIAGPDGLDPRQADIPSPLPSYTQALRKDLRGVHVGVVRESFGWPDVSERDVDEAVRTAAAEFKSLGADVREVSIPMHRDGIHLWNAIVTEGALAMMVKGEGMGHAWKGHYDTNLVEFFARSRRVRANDFSHTVKVIILLGHYMAERYHSHYYAKAQNLRRTLQAAYDEAFREVDLLLMPTTPQKAWRHKPNVSVREYLAMAQSSTQNASPFNVTGHPAMSIPCGISGGLPVGLMMVGRYFEENTLLTAAYAFEQRLDKNQ